MVPDQMALKSSVPRFNSKKCARHFFSILTIDSNRGRLLVVQNNNSKLKKIIKLNEPSFFSINMSDEPSFFTLKSSQSVMY